MTAVGHSDGDSLWPKHWRRFLIAIMLLIWADLGSTLAAVDMVGLGAEANPLMRWLLGHELAIVLLVHMLVFVLTIIAFAGVVHIGQSLDGKQATWYRVGCSVWITGMIVVGVLVLVNNLALAVLPALI